MRETMTSRQRVLAAINHEQADRMPIDLGMHYSTGISAFAYWNLRQHLGLGTDAIDIPDMIQFLARVDEDILTRFHCDCMLLNPGWRATTQWNPRGAYQFQIPATAQMTATPDGSWLVTRGEQTSRLPANGFFFDGGWPGFDDDAPEIQLQRTAAEAERIFKETEYFTTYIGYHAYFNSDVEWMCAMLTDPEEIMANNTAIHEAQLAHVKGVIDSMGSHIQAIAINADLGTQNAPFCRPTLFDDMCAPFIKQFCDYVHDNSDLKIFMHSCGSIQPFLPTLIDCGVDIINPVQISAQNMDPATLKARYGEEIVFWGGGCNTQEILAAGTPDDVRANVRELTRVFKPGGGFVFNQVHNIMGNVPPENIVAMLDTAYAESFYTE
ncbi:MAG TPA: uroporphyrinogen decarboxylase family protein [Armatimonadota bacterium]|jgi:uroporphyrinogen decarboxylase